MRLKMRGKPWWAEVEATCDQCETQVILEASDRPTDDTSLLKEAASGFFVCPVCGAKMLVNNPLANQR